MGDFAWALLFWLVYEALALPLRWALTPCALGGDVRRLLSRVAGPALLGLTAGALSHGFLKLGPATGWGLAGIAGAAGAGFAWHARGRAGLREAAVETLPARAGSWKRDLMLEGVLLASFLGFVAFRRLAPEMTFEVQNSGAEKFPNAMLFWSCWHAEHLPPRDYWFAGLPQTYYYWGHFFWSWVGRMGGFPAESVIALGLARSTVLVSEAGYVLQRALGLRWKGALLGALLMAWGGNPQAWLTLRQQYEYQVRAAETDPAGSVVAGAEAVLRTVKEWDWSLYSFWEPSRVIANTVNEFPAWSAILGDFHAHHLALPWLIGWFAVLAGGDRWLLRQRDGSCGGNRGLIPGAVLFAGLAVMACLANVWSLPVVLAASPVILLWRRRGDRGIPAAAVLALALVGALAIGLGPKGAELLAPLGPDVEAGLGRGLPVRLLDPGLRSTDRELFRLWGFQVSVLIAAIGVFCLREWRQRRAAGWAAAALGLAVLKALAAGGAAINRNEPALYWLALGCGVIAAGQGRRPWLSMPAVAAGAGACTLLAGLEMFYVRDRMTGELARYNSYFKFSYAAWPLLSATACVGATRLWNLPRPRSLRWALRAALLPMIPAAMGMLIFGVPARVLQARLGDAGPRRPTLNAFAWLEIRTGYRAEAEALAWIREHVPVGEVVATEASSSAYSYQGRVASLAGRPIPLGWAHHEAQWRGEGIYDGLARRHQSVNDLFLAGDADRMRQAAAALSARWALLGKNEREVYGPVEFERTLGIMRAAAQMRAAFPAGAPEVYVFEFTSP